MKKLPAPSSMNQKGCKVLPLHPNRRYHNNMGSCPLSAPLLCKKKKPAAQCGRLLCAIRRETRFDEMILAGRLRCVNRMLINKLLHQF